MGVSEQQPSIGRIVHYRLSEQDVADIFVAHGTETGHFNVGDVLPAQIIRVGENQVQLSVNLGSALLARYAGPVSVPTTNGCWFWPPRVGG